MRTLGTCLALVVLAQSAPERTRVTSERWAELVAEAEASAELTIHRVERLRALCASHLVTERGKVLDIEPHGEGVLVRVCGLRDGLQREPFVATKEEAKAVRSWSRWDRLEWCTEPVWDNNGIRLRRMVESMADVTRTPNPGIEWPDFKEAPLSFEDFRKRIAAHLERRQPRAALEYVRSMGSVAFPFCAVVDSHGGQGVHVRFPDGSVQLVPTLDPQLKEAVPEGTKVRVAVFVSPISDTPVGFAQMNGQMRLDLVLWGLRK